MSSSRQYRVGLRYRWVPGLATVLPDDDPLARQRRIIRWAPAYRGCGPPPEHNAW
jgi:hypothetical protein